MPRVEIIPAGWDQSKEKARGDGAPTVDLCRSCALELTEGEPVPQWLEEIFPDATIGSTDVAHPPYEEIAPVCEHSPFEEFDGEACTCEHCGTELVDTDNNYDDSP